MNDPFTWTLTCPAVPVQAQGRTAEGAPFYFRARHGGWTLELGGLGWPESYLDWPGKGRLIASGFDPDNGWGTEEAARDIVRGVLSA